MAENFDLIEGDIRPTRRKRIGRKSTAKKGNRRLSRRSRRATSKAKLLYLQKTGFSKSSKEDGLSSDEENRLEIYSVVLRTLWWAKNFRERFIGIDDPSRGRYRWQHNAPEGQETMNIYIALKDIFLQCHGTASVLRKKEDFAVQNHKLWLDDVNKFLETLNYGFEGRLFDKKTGSSELCYFSIRRNKFYQPNDHGSGDQSNRTSFENQEQNDLGSTGGSSNSLYITTEDELINGNFEIVIAFLDRLENKSADDEYGDNENSQCIQLSTLKSVKMRDFPGGNEEQAQIRIKYGQQEKVDVLVPFLDENSANDPDSLTPEMITKGFQMILCGASGYKGGAKGASNTVENFIPGDDVAVEKSALNLKDVYSTMSQVYTSRLNRAADVIFDILTSLYCCHHGIENPKLVMRGLESLQSHNITWWQPCVLTLPAKNMKRQKATMAGRALSERDASFYTFIQELVVTWNEGTSSYINALPAESPRRNQKRKQPAPFLPSGAISFWHDIDILDILDICGIHDNDTMLGMCEFTKIIRDLMVWRAFSSKKDSALPSDGEPRFHLLQRPGIFLIRLKWPGQPRSWPERISSLGVKAVWNMVSTEHFEIDLLEAFDTLGAKKKTRAVTRRAEKAIYRLKQIVCFSITGQFYLFKSASETDSNAWHLITSNTNVVSCLDWDDIRRLCVHRRAFPELLFYEDSTPSLYEKMDMHRRKRLRQDNLHSTIDHDGPLVLPIMSLVPGKGDVRDGLRILNDSDPEYGDADDDNDDLEDEERSILMNYLKHEQRRLEARASKDSTSSNNEWCKCVVS